MLLLTPRAVSAPVSEQLQEVDLSKNKLSGQMPGAGFDRLSLLDLSGNTFSYPPPQALKRACAGSKLACVVREIQKQDLFSRGTATSWVF